MDVEKSQFVAKIESLAASGAEIGIELFSEAMALLDEDQQLIAYSELLDIARSRNSALSLLPISSQKSSIV